MKLMNFRVPESHPIGGRNYETKALQMCNSLHGEEQGSLHSSIFGLQFKESPLYEEGEINPNRRINCETLLSNPDSFRKKPGR
jgi:hypothetical protein